MRVCMFVYYYWPEQAGGAENQCRKLSNELTAKGHQVTVVTSLSSIKLHREGLDGEVRVIRLPIFESLYKGRPVLKSDNGNTHVESEKCKNSSVKTGQLRSFVSRILAHTVRYLNILIFYLALILYMVKRRNQFDVLHVHTADWIAGASTVVGKILGIPVICKGADIPVFPELHCVPAKRIIDRCRKLPYFIALTHAMTDDLISNGVCKNKISVIPNGVEIPNNRVISSENSDFLFLGNFSQTAAHKGFDVLLEAWREVMMHEPRARLVMAGGGDYSQWYQLACRYNIEHSISFLGYCPDVKSVFMKSCCLLLPSRKEGISNALLEAQSFGLPAIVSDIPGNREIVINEETGIIVPVNSSSELSDAIISLYRDPILRDQYGQAAKDRIESNFSIETVASHVEALYSKVVR